MSFNIKKHGHSPHRGASPTYRTWSGMIQRCKNPNEPAFNRYGGRGITVCDDWLNFEGFLADMGERPKGKSLDRIDNNGGYCPENCRWATRKEQSNNTRTNRRITYKGKTKTLAEWSRCTGIKPSTLRTRLWRGWSIRRALEVE